MKRPNIETILSNHIVKLHEEIYRLRRGIQLALIHIPNCSYEPDAKVYLEHALFNRPLIRDPFVGRDVLDNKKKDLQIGDTP